MFEVVLLLHFALSPQLSLLFFFLCVCVGLRPETTSEDVFSACKDGDEFFCKEWVMNPDNDINQRSDKSTMSVHISHCPNYCILLMQISHVHVCFSLAHL